MIELGKIYWSVNLRADTEEKAITSGRCVQTHVNTEGRISVALFSPEKQHPDIVAAKLCFSNIEAAQACYRAYRDAQIKIDEIEKSANHEISELRKTYLGEPEFPELADDYKPVEVAEDKPAATAEDCPAVEPQSIKEDE